MDMPGSAPRGKTPRGPIEVLVTDARTRAGLAVARSLARRGVSFLAVDHEPRSLGFYSHAVKYALRCPPLTTDPTGFLAFATDAIQRYGIRLVMPVSDQALLFFEQHRERFERLVRLAMPSSPALRGVLDKRRNLELARRLGVPCPRQFELTDPREIPAMIDALGFPIVLKRPGDPFDPHVPTFDFRVLYAHTEAELRALIARHCPGGVYPLFQERAVGEVHSLCAFAVRGDVVAVHEYHSIRRLQGAGVLRRIVPAAPDLVAHTRRLLGALEWDGVAHLGFFVSQDRQRTWYMETNGRFWASVQGSVNAGWDFPIWMYDYFLHGTAPRPGPLQMGSLTRWHLGDLEALLEYLRGGEIPTTGAHHGKLRAVLQYLGGFRPGIRSELFRWRDPLPFLIDHADLFQRAWRNRTPGSRQPGGPSSTPGRAPRGALPE